MKRTFPTTAPGKDDARVRDKIRHEINKYVRREQRKPLPDGYRRWEFLCRVGTSEQTAEERPLKEIGGALDTLAADGAAKLYVEIVATPAKH